MTWYAHLVLAEAVRLGARLFCRQLAAAPFASRFAGAGCLGLANDWQLLIYPGGYRSVIRCRQIGQLPPETVVVAAGPIAAAGMVASTPALWLDPPGSTTTSNMDPLSNNMPRLFAGDRLPEALRSALSDFAEALVSGTIDPWDWIQTHVAGHAGFGPMSWSRPGEVTFGLEPLGTVVAANRTEVEQLVVTGKVRLEKGAPVTLRLPTLGAAEVALDIGVRAKGSVIASASAGTTRLPVQQVRAPDGCILTVSAGEDVAWVDLTLDARRGEVTDIAMRLPQDDAGQLGVADPLERYGDPLDAYVGSEVP